MKKLIIFLSILVVNNDSYGQQNDLPSGILYSVGDKTIEFIGGHVNFRSSTGAGSFQRKDESLFELKKAYSIQANVWLLDLTQTIERNTYYKDNELDRTTENEVNQGCLYLLVSLGNDAWGITELEGPRGEEQHTKTLNYIINDKQNTATMNRLKAAFIPSPPYYFSYDKMEELKGLPSLNKLSDEAMIKLKGKIYDLVTAMDCEEANLELRFKQFVFNKLNRYNGNALAHLNKSIFFLFIENSIYPFGALGEFKNYHQKIITNIRKHQIVDRINAKNDKMEARGIVGIWIQEVQYEAIITLEINRNTILHRNYSLRPTMEFEDSTLLYELEAQALEDEVPMGFDSIKGPIKSEYLNLQVAPKYSFDDDDMLEFGIPKMVSIINFKAFNDSILYTENISTSLNDSVISTGGEQDKYFLLSMGLLKKYSELPINLSQKELDLIKQKTIEEYKKNHPTHKKVFRHGYSEVDLLFFEKVAAKGANPFFTID